MEKRKCRLMVIDDEPIVGKRLKQILEKAGYEAEIFTDSLSALNGLKENNYDIVITDLKMKGADGIKILETAKEENPETRVIIITGFAEMDTAKEAFKKGVFDFIAKPFKIEELKEVILKAEKEIADLEK